LHVDTNGRPWRYVTAIIYLTTVPPAGDGATIFPCASPVGSSVEGARRHSCVVATEARAAGEHLVKEGTLHSGTLVDPDHAPLAKALTTAAEDGLGISVYPEVGKLAIFYSRMNDGQPDGSSWHGGAAVGPASSQCGKWILQFFKEVMTRLVSWRFAASHQNL